MGGSGKRGGGWGQEKRLKIRRGNGIKAAEKRPFATGDCNQLCLILKPEPKNIPPNEGRGVFFFLHGLLPILYIACYQLL